MLLSLATLKTRLAITSTANDTALTTLVNGVAAAFEKHCDRLFERGSGVEQFDGAPALVLRRAPVESLALYYDVERAFGADTLLAADDDYVLDSSTGLVRLLFAPHAGYPLCLKAVVTGGYAAEGTTPGTGQTALPGDLVRLLLQQIEFEWKNHGEFGKQSISLQGQSTSVADYDLLPGVKAGLQPYKRIAF